MNKEKKIELLKVIYPILEEEIDSLREDKRCSLDGLLKELDKEGETDEMLLNVTLIHAIEQVSTCLKREAIKGFPEYLLKNMETFIGPDKKKDPESKKEEPKKEEKQEVKEPVPSID